MRGAEAKKPETKQKAPPVNLTPKNRSWLPVIEVLRERKSEAEKQQAPAPQKGPTVFQRAVDVLTGNKASAEEKARRTNPEAFAELDALEVEFVAIAAQAGVCWNVEPGDFKARVAALDTQIKSLAPEIKRRQSEILSMMGVSPAHVAAFRAGDRTAIRLAVAAKVQREAHSIAHRSGFVPPIPPTFN